MHCDALSPIVSWGQVDLGYQLRQGSGVDNKIYALVVLGGAFVTIGSYFLLHFTLPFCFVLSTGFMMGGAFVLQHCKTKEINEISKNLMRPSLGLHNSENNCWINVVLQGLCHIESYRKVLCAEKNAELETALGPLYQACQLYAQEQSDGKTDVSSVDSQEIRIWAAQHIDGVRIDGNYGVPSDLFGLIHAILMKFLPLSHAACQRMFAITTNLFMNENGENFNQRDFHDAFSHFFTSNNTHFTESPEDFLVEVNKYNRDGSDVIDLPAAIPLSFKLDRLHCPKNPGTYQLDYFVVMHLSFWGLHHFSCYVKKHDDEWLHLNDGQCDTVPVLKAKTALQKATLVHYTRKS